MAKEISVYAIRSLKENRAYLTRQQYLTLKGQILAGDHVGAMKGLQTILTRR